MSDKKDDAAPQAPAASDPKPAPAAAAPAAPAPDAAAEQARTERARFKAIMGCEEAKGRAKLAQHLALETSMSAAEAKALLAASALETAPGGVLGLAGAMGALKNPDVGADTADGGEAGAGKPQIDTQAIYAMWNKPQGAAKTH